MSEAVKLMRSPIDTNCVHCPTKIPFGVWCYYEPHEGNAICIECGTKKGWTSKERVNLLIKKLEIQEDIKALRKQRKLETEALLTIQRQVNLHEIGEGNLKLEGQITKLMARADEYLRACGSEDEKKTLKTVFEEIRKAQELQKKIRNLIRDRIFMLEKKKRRVDMQLAFTEEEPQEE